MIAVDTNVWVRYVTNDDSAQAARALRLLETSEDIWVPKTVLLEVEWVLRAVYRLPGQSIQKAILHILGLPNVLPESPEQVSKALDLYGSGLDFANALHLVGRGNASLFYSFDESLLKMAKKAGSNVAMP